MGRITICFALSLSFLALGSAAASDTANAASQTGPRTVDCELEVDGTTYIDGVCEFTPMGGGDFQIGGDGYFAQVDVQSKGKALGFWNGSPGASHAQGPLGELQQKGACWVGSKATVCAKNLSDAANAKNAAARPDGYMLYPDVAGASTSCLSLQGGAKVGSKLILHSCEVPDDLVFVKKAGGEVGIYGNPNLCLGFSSPVTLKTCSEYEQVWTMEGDGSQASAIETGDGGCLTIPDLDRAGAKFPFDVLNGDCSDPSTTAVRFYMSKN